MQKASFNPHTHEGCDLCILQRGHGIAVSIHTPTKGVTWCQLCRDWLCYVSIHTPTKGVTYSAYRIFLDPQSFNPHTHEGCDPVGNPAEPCRLVSIHTPTKGVTGKTRFQCRAVSVSIHTPTKGVTEDLNTECHDTRVSIHTPTKGVTFPNQL